MMGLVMPSLLAVLLLGFRLRALLHVYGLDVPDQVHLVSQHAHAVGQFALVAHTEIEPVDGRSQPKPGSVFGGDKRSFASGTTCSTLELRSTAGLRVKVMTRMVFSFFSLDEKGAGSPRCRVHMGPRP